MDSSDDCFKKEMKTVFESERLFISSHISVDSLHEVGMNRSELILKLLHVTQPSLCFCSQTLEIVNSLLHKGRMG